MLCIKTTREIIVEESYGDVIDWSIHSKWIKVTEVLNPYKLGDGEQNRRKIFINTDSITEVYEYNEYEYV